MRFGLVALSATALAALTTGCSDPVPATPDAAWFVSTSQIDATTCHMAQHNTEFGTVNDSQKTQVEIDGMDMSTVQCTVGGTGTGPYMVDALAQNQNLTLQLNIPAITTQASQAKPAIGAISYEDLEKTAVPYSGNCNFYFVPSTMETVASGKIWVAFTCDSITNGDTMSTCPLKQGYAIFENCLMGDEM